MLFACMLFACVFTCVLICMLICMHVDLQVYWFACVLCNLHACYLHACYLHAWYLHMWYLHAWYLHACYCMRVTCMHVICMGYLQLVTPKLAWTLAWGFNNWVEQGVWHVVCIGCALLCISLHRWRQLTLGRRMSANPLQDAWGWLGGEKGSVLAQHFDERTLR